MDYVYPDATSKQAFLDNTQAKLAQFLVNVKQGSLIAEESTYTQVTNAMFAVELNYNIIDNGTIYYNSSYPICVQLVISRPRPNPRPASNCSKYRCTPC